MSHFDGLSIDQDSPIRIVVTPSQSAYFAGELFSVTITFKNTRSPDYNAPVRAFSQGVSPSHTQTHKRSAHSVSSAPLARPPTSPGTPRTATTALSTRSRNGDERVGKKGLIGKRPSAVEGLSSKAVGRVNRMHGKSMSLAIAPQELESLREEGNPKSAPLTKVPFSNSLPELSASPAARSPNFPLSPEHPHARKQSLFDGQLQLHDLTTSTTLSKPTSTITTSASTSTFSLALDPIAEFVPSPYPPSPIPGSPISNAEVLTPTSSSSSTPPPRTRASRPSQLGLGQPSHSTRNNRAPPPPRAGSASFAGSPFSASTTSPSELILYSYAHLTGTLNLTPPHSPSPSPAAAAQASNLNALRASLLKRGVVGGGSMDIINSSQHKRAASMMRRPSHGRASSFSAGLMSLLSPTASTLSSSVSALETLATMTPSAMARTPSGSTTPIFPGSFPRATGSTNGAPNVAPGAAVGIGLGLGASAETVDPEAALPTFDIQPEMLAVDLSLAPGESRSYTYTLRLPDNLPPTFKGRSLKFSYELVVGICRAGSAPSSVPNTSRVMKVPVRVYNHVSVGRISKPYDLLWPVSKRIKQPDYGVKVIEQQGQEINVLGRPYPTSPQLGGSFGDLQDYAQRLLASFPEPGIKGVRIKLPPESASSERQRRGQGGYGDADRESEGGLTGCREAVEILTRNPKKMSYDVNKDGVNVAVLTFTKPAYRLGETVLGVVELNDRKSRARILQLSAMLEAHETLPSSISSPSSSRHMRRVHAEHHSSFVLSMLRTTFALDIPSDASPAFQIQIGGDTTEASGGLQWKVRLCLLVAVASSDAYPGTEGVRLKSLVRDGPRGEWGSSWTAPSQIAPMERMEEPRKHVPTPAAAKSWTSFFASSFLGTSQEDEEEEETDNEYDGIKSDAGGGVGVGVDYAGGDEGWREVKIETVECEVPIRVWPGNTAFKAVDVVFDV